MLPPYGDRIKRLMSYGGKCRPTTQGGSTNVCDHSNFLEDNISGMLQNSQWMVCYLPINMKCVFSCKCLASAT